MIHSPKVGSYLTRSAAHGRVIGDIGNPPRAAELLADRLNAVGNIHERHPGTFRHKSAGNRFSNTACSTDYHHNVITQSEFHYDSPC
jgi:hypothetical protein